MATCIVPTGTPGYEVLKVERKLGRHASDTCALAFNAMKIAGERQAGKPCLTEASMAKLFATEMAERARGTVVMSAYARRLCWLRGLCCGAPPIN